jgi:hypothetical protein
MHRLWLLPLVLAAQAVAQPAEPNRDPMKARLITSDIAAFWRVFDKAPLKDAADLFQREYIDAGSPGLRGFIQARIQSGRHLAAIVAMRPRYFAAIRESTLALDQKPELKEAIQASFRRMKELYPDAIFPDVYFLIGSLNSGGTTSSRGLLIGVEMSARGDDTPVDELSNWERAVVGTIANLPNMVAHELIHIEQRHASAPGGNRGASTLLAKALEEGGADFLGEMISGETINRVQRVYGDEREQALWTEFSAAMRGTDTTHWMYQGDSSKDRPADLGYYVGFKICEAFYKHAADKQEAIRRILALSDADAFLKESGYGDGGTAKG